MQISAIKLTLTASALILSTAITQAATCSMFATQAEAQAYFIKYKAKELDRDKDGEACECLPGGSKDGAAICKKSKK